MWHYLFSGLLSFIAFTCSDAIHSKPEELKLSVPKQDADNNFIDTAANNIHVIIEQAGMYGYEGQNINSAQQYSLENFLQYQHAGKKKRECKEWLVRCIGMEAITVWSVRTSDLNTC